MQQHKLADEDSFDQLTNCGQNGKYSCFYCDKKHYTADDYRLLFQTKEDFSRGYNYLICSPDCQEALNQIGTTCRHCSQNFVHDIYDNWICNKCGQTQCYIIV
jgi:hypothetical protein